MIASVYQSQSAQPNASIDDEGRRFLSPIRHARLLALVQANKSITVTAAAAALGVSDMTIRRDLAGLEREGKLRRIHGGAIAAQRSAPVAMDTEEPSFEARLQQRQDAKSAIAAAAAALASNFRTIAIDCGTTTYLAAVHLKALKHAKLFTNSLRIAALSAGGDAEIYVAGGRVRADEMSICGAAATEQFRALWFDVALIGVSGITEDGLYDYAFDDADMKRVYLERSGTKIVLCDAAKFQRMSLVRIAALSDIDAIVTDAEPPIEIAAALAAANVALHIAPPLAE